MAVGVRVESEGLPLSSFPVLFDNKVGFGVGLIANVGAGETDAKGVGSFLFIVHSWLICQFGPICHD